MTKTLFELQIDRLRYALLASGEADGDATSDALTIEISPPSAEYVVVPIGIFLQTTLTGDFSNLLNAVTLWNQQPLRRATISRKDSGGNAIVGASTRYALGWRSPRYGELSLMGLEVAALDAVALKGTTLSVELDGIVAGEWQAGYVNYKFIRSNEDPVYYP